MKAIVICTNSGNYIIQDLKTLVIISNAKVKGSIKQNVEIVAGDYVEYDLDHSTYVICKLYERKNQIIRPKIANIDNLFIIQSIIEPDVNIKQLFKYDSFYRVQGIKNIFIILTKTDLLNNNKNNEILVKLKEEYLLKVFDYHDSNDRENIIEIISNGLNCFVGQSGTGKSTFLNSIIPELNLKTNEISKALNRGKHTTTTTTLFKFRNGYLVDTPGFSSVEINCTKLELSKLFYNFDKIVNNCKFNDCLHIKNVNCAICAEMDNQSNIINKDTYNEYLNLLNTLKK